MTHYPRCEHCPSAPIIVTEFILDQYVAVEGPLTLVQPKKRQCGNVQTVNPRLNRLGILPKNEPFLYDRASERIITQWRCRHCHNWHYFDGTRQAKIVLDKPYHFMKIQKVGRNRF